MAKGFEKFRTIVLDCNHREKLKSGCSCDNLRKTILLIHTFKSIVPLFFLRRPTGW